MLPFFIYFLTAVLVLDCLFLILLVLVQLPKKEAGMGQAFGGAATDALFGAGSGNVLTKATKWGAGIFFALAITLTLMGNFQNKSGGGSELQKRMNAIKPADSAPATPAPAADAPKTNANVLQLTAPTNNPAK
jgi:preprotein translocase subunit SecG